MASFSVPIEYKIVRNIQSVRTYVTELAQSNTPQSLPLILVDFAGATAGGGCFDMHSTYPVICRALPLTLHIGVCKLYIANLNSSQNKSQTAMSTQVTSSLVCDSYPVYQWHCQIGMYTDTPGRITGPSHCHDS